MGLFRRIDYPDRSGWWDLRLGGWCASLSEKCKYSGLRTAAEGRAAGADPEIRNHAVAIHTGKQSSPNCRSEDTTIAEAGSWHIKKKLYIFDNKHSILYEINLKDGESKIIGSNEIGFVKYKNKEFVSCSKSEYKNDKIKYNKFVSIYKYKNNNGLYKTIKDNEGIIQKISNDEVIILGEYDNVLYYLLKNKVYKYDPMKNIKQVLFENELEFNNTNMIFVYNE